MTHDETVEMLHQIVLKRRPWWKRWRFVPGIYRKARRMGISRHVSLALSLTPVGIRLPW